MDFKELSEAIESLHHAFAIQAGQSVNMALTLRNWLMGFYVKEYEQKGQDRAKYGAKLLQKLGGSLMLANIPAASHRSLKQYRQFYESYPQIGREASAQLKLLIQQKKIPLSIGQTVPAQLGLAGNSTKQVKQTRDTPTLPSEQLIKNLAYSHFVELMKIDDPLKRSFYEIESIHSNWSSRELRRQISTLYYERLGLSKNKEKIAKMIETGTYAHEIRDVIREPYMFEFVGVKREEVVSEAAVASSLLRQLNSFFLEMGRGFCFEASNKKILIGDQFYFIDLVLYHRILKCNFLIELKINELNHENVSQLNTYVNYYKKNELHTGDNPPVGLLLCTEKNEALVEYALGGMDNQLFVSKYKLQLPSQKEVKMFLEKKLHELPLASDSEKDR
jgi:predicted nuclease of restriction endonuclease-like (RecB) superfamily